MPISSCHFIDGKALLATARLISAASAKLSKVPYFLLRAAPPSSLVCEWTSVGRSTLIFHAWSALDRREDATPESNNRERGSRHPCSRSRRVSRWVVGRETADEALKRPLTTLAPTRRRNDVIYRLNMQISEQDRLNAAINDAIAHVYSSMHSAQCYCWVVNIRVYCGVNYILRRDRVRFLLFHFMDAFEEDRLDSEKKSGGKINKKRPTILLS